MNQDTLTSQKLIFDFLQASIERIGHLEQLILGVATLGLAGWGFLHATPDHISRRIESLTQTGRIVFASIFSGFIAAAYNALFMGRMAVNLTLLNLEHQLITPVTPYLDFFTNAGGNIRYIYYFAAVLIPMMSFSSLVYTTIDVSRIRIKSRKIVLQVLLVICYVTTLETTRRSIASIINIMHRVKELAPGFGEGPFGL